MTNKAPRKIRIAINGFGRIGRTFFRVAFEKPEFEFVAVNDLTDSKNLAYLLTFDTVYGKYEHPVRSGEGKIFVGDREIKIFAEPDPEKLPWKELGIDVVVESTGRFTEYEEAAKHLDAGAKHVVISAKSRSESVGHLLPGASAEKFSQRDFPNITSDASCTTNAVAPVASIMAVNPGVQKALLNTVHGYTASQNLVDGPRKDWRRGRAAASNIVPTTTSAAIATSKVLPGFENIFDGMALRVPVITGSIIDFVFLAKRETSREEINEIFRQAEKEPHWQKILRTTEDPLVSSDIIKDSYPSIVDLSFTQVVGGNLARVLSWYDNEWGYSNSLVEHVLLVGGKYVNL